MIVSLRFYDVDLVVTRQIYSNKIRDQLIEMASIFCQPQFSYRVTIKFPFLLADVDSRLADLFALFHETRSTQHRTRQYSDTLRNRLVSHNSQCFSPRALHS